jgi:hypothetical protein
MMRKNVQVDRESGGEHSSIKHGGWRPPGGYDEANVWALENRQALEQYARRNEKDGTAAEQLERYLAKHPETVNGSHGEI